jgi:hypothetical protein
MPNNNPTIIPLAQPRHAHRRAQLPGLYLLLTRDGERTLEICFRFRRIPLRRFQRDFAGNAIDFGLLPAGVQSEMLYDLKCTALEMRHTATVSGLPKISYRSSIFLETGIIFPNNGFWMVFLRFCRFEPP